MFSAMRFIAVAAALAGLTSAQGTLPPCATECVTQFTSGSAIGGCSSLDIVCICSNKGFLSGIACCLEGKCSVADQEAATNYAIGFCKISGVTNLPTGVSEICTATSSSSGSSSTSAAGAATTSSASSASSSQSSASSSVSNASKTVSSPVSSVSSSVSLTTTGVSSQASSSTSSGSASATKNAGSQNVAGLGAGVLGGLAAAVALL